ncbi:MAG: S-layer family protein, partial [Gammaproteobacteria bacterium]|nr:S-layer family protein [Gammaproteobacteria bacterium]
SGDGGGITSGSIVANVGGTITNGVTFTTGTATDITTAGNDNVTSGSISLTASSIGTTGNDVSVTIGAATAGSANDTGELNLDSNAAGGAGDIFITTASDLELGTVDTGAGADDISVTVTGGNTLTLTAALDEDVNPTLAGDNLIFDVQTGTFNGNGQAIDVGAAGTLDVTGDTLVAGSFSGVQQAGGGITIAPFTGGRLIGLGSEATTGHLDFNDADLDALVVAGGNSLTIGSGTAGAVSMDDVTFTAGQTLTIITGATINDDDDVGASFSGGTLVLTGGTGIGTTTTLNIDADTLVASVTGVGGIDVTDSDDVQLGDATLDAGISTTDGDIDITAGSITTAAITGDVISSASPTVTGNITLAATDGGVTISDTVTATSGDNIVITANDADEDGTNSTPANISINGALTSNGGNITLEAADNIALGAAVNAGAGNASIVADDDANTRDAGPGDNVGNITGAGLVTANTATLTAAQNIGTGGTNINTAVATLDVSVIGTGDIFINEADAVDLFDVDTNDGSITIQSGGAMTITDVVAGGAGDVSATTTAGDILVVGNLDATGDQVTLTSAGAINDNAVTDDAATDITATTIDLNAATGIGSARALELVGSSISAVSTAGNIEFNNTASGATTITNVQVQVGAGSINIDQTGNQSLAVDSASTANGAINIDNTGGDLTLTSVTAGGANNAIARTLTSGNIIVGDVNAAGDQVILNSTGAINDNNGGANNITANTLTADAAGAITLDTDIATADVSSTGTGDITLTEADAVDLFDVDNTDGAITVTAGGALTATDVVTTGGADTDDITLQGTSIEVDTINAAGLGDVSLTATGGAIDDADADSAITADALTLNANTTIGATNAIGTDVNSINLTSGGDIAISEADSVTITGLVTGGGADTIDITVAGGGTIDWNTPLTSGTLAGDDLNLTTNANGSVIDNGNDLNLGGGTLAIIADTIDLSGTVTAGAITVAAATANASIGLGSLAVGAVTAQDFVLSNGTIVNLLNASSTLSVGDASSGDVVMEGVDVTTATGAVALTVQAGTGFGIEDANGAAGGGFTGGSDDTLNLTSDGVIGGNANGFEVDTGIVNVTASGGNNVTFSDLGVANFNSTYDVVTGGAGNVSITQTNNNLDVDQITTTGNVTLTATNAAITDANGVTNNVSASLLTADSATGIDLDTTIATADLTVTGAGAIDINETDGITLNGVDTANGSITVQAANTINLGTGAVSSTAGDVTLTATGGGSILDTGGTSTITGSTVTLQADTDLGSILGTDLSTDADNLNLTATGGEIGLAETDGVTLDSVTAGTDINIAAVGTINLGGDVTATAGNVDLAAGGVGSSILDTGAPSTITGSTLTLTAITDIGQAGNAILTDASNIDVTVTNGEIAINETDAGGDGLVIDGASANGDINIQNAGNGLNIDGAITSVAGDVFLSTGGSMTDTGGGNTIDGDNIVLSATNDVGVLAGNALSTQANALNITATK